MQLSYALKYPFEDKDWLQKLLMLAAIGVVSWIPIIGIPPRVGLFVRYIPYPVISGFMSGIGVIIVLLQIHPLLGSPSVGSPLVALARLPEALSALNPHCLLLSGLTMLIVFLTPARVTRVVPSPLVALLCVSLLSNLLGFSVPTIGEIPSGLPRLVLPTVSAEQLPRILAMALALSILGVIDSLLTSIVADSITRERHDSNRELVGQGIGNAVAGLIGGLPGAGATMRRRASTCPTSASSCPCSSPASSCRS